MAVLKLTGTAGRVSGAILSLAEGAEAEIGRSRACGLSLHGIVAAGKSGEGPGARAFRTVSRRHAVIRFAGPGEVAIRDRSRHGTFLDGERIDEAVVQDLASRAHALRLGAEETFRIEIAE